jgi:hypothetical protein
VQVIDVMDTGPVLEFVPVGLGIDILFCQDGRVRVAHDCKLIGGDRRIRTAPYLQLGEGHTIVTREPLTIVASILCDDCGLHGFVTAGAWIPC